MTLTAMRHWVGGRWVPGEGAAVSLRTPIDGRFIGEAAFAGAATLERALASADAARDAMAGLSIARRVQALRDLADAIEQRAPAIAERITLENGCPSKQSLRIQALSAVGLLRGYAQLVEAHRFEEVRPGL